MVVLIKNKEIFSLLAFNFSEIDKSATKSIFYKENEGENQKNSEKRLNYSTIWKVEKKFYNLKIRLTNFHLILKN